MPGPIQSAVKQAVQTVARTAEKVVEKAADKAAPVAQKVVETAKSTFEKTRTAPVNLSGQSPTTPLEQPSGTGGGTPVMGPVARDGSAATAVAWAESKRTQDGHAAGYDNYCLDFVTHAYAIHQNPARCPEIYGANGTNNAIGAYNALNANGKILPATGTPDPNAPLPEGAIVFFDKTDDNGQDGHICIATGRMAEDGTPEVITSGYPGSSGVHYSSIGALSEESGPYIGYTTPELAFGAGTYPTDSAQQTPATGTSALDAPSGAGAGAGTAANPAGDVPQGWNNTCGANALMAMEAAVSPERAAQLAAMTPEERKAYEGAVLRSDPQNATFPLGQRPGGTTNGWGEYMMARQVSERFGGEAQVVRPANRGQAVDNLTAMLFEGKPVAIGLGTHWMSATDIRDGENGREILVHDSWTGTSAWVPEADMRQPGNGWVQTHFPGAASFGGAIGSLVAPGQPVLDSSSTYRASEANVLPGVQALMDE